MRFLGILAASVLGALLALAPHRARADESQPAPIQVTQHADGSAFVDERNPTVKKRRPVGPRRSPGALIAGVITEVIAGGAVATGAVLLIASQHPDFLGLGRVSCEIISGIVQPGAAQGSQCVKTPENVAMRNAGIATVVGGLALIAVGTPLIVYGARREAVPNEVPTVSVAPAGVSLGWRF